MIVDAVALITRALMLLTVCVVGATTMATYERRDGGQRLALAVRVEDEQKEALRGLHGSGSTREATTTATARSYPAAVAAEATTTTTIAEEKKRRIVRVNDALRPWVETLAGVMRHGPLEKAHSAWKEGRSAPVPREGKAFVYVRLNLANDAFYIGETEHWGDRVKAHFMGCYRHSERCARQCRRCDEHAKYRKHRACDPHGWIMCPLWECEPTATGCPKRLQKCEAKRLERTLIRKWKPTCNQRDRPFWLLKEAYASDFRKGRTQPRDRKPPWTRSKETRVPVTLPILTTYEAEGERPAYDIGIILARFAERDTGVSIQVNTGRMDVTHWGRVRRRYGRSLMVIQHHDGERENVRLDKWRWNRKECRAFKLWVRPEVTEAREDEREALLSEADNYADLLERSSEEDLAFFWRVRNVLDRQSKIKMRQLIWAECIRRYESMTKVPVTVRLPYFEQLRGQTVRREISQMIQSIEGWPQFLKDWHVSKVRIVTESRPSLDEILVNVNKPWHEHKGCKCHEFEERLRAAGYRGEIKKTRGHVFFTGREWDGPHRAALNVAAMNIPTQTRWDLKWAWERVQAQLPEIMRGTQTSWSKKLHGCCAGNTEVNRGRRDGTFPTTRDAYAMRRLVKELMVGPLDKNGCGGALAVLRPTLYTAGCNVYYKAKSGEGNDCEQSSRQGTRGCTQRS